MWQLSQSRTAPDLSARRWASMPRTTSRRPTMSSFSAEASRRDSSRRIVDQRSRPLMPLPAGSNAARTSPPMQVADLALGERAARVLLDQAQGNHPLGLRGVAGGAGDGVQVERRVRQPDGVDRHGGRVTADAGRADQFGPGAALHVVSAVAIRAERGVEVIAGRAGLAVHAPAVGREHLARGRCGTACRRASRSAPSAPPRGRCGSRCTPERLGPGAQQREVNAPLGLAQLVGVAAGAGAGRPRWSAIAARPALPAGCALVENPVWQSEQAWSGCTEALSLSASTASSTDVPSGR